MPISSPSQSAAREPDFIEVLGAREHNLDIDRLEVPKRKLVVFTGVSGSGKSSLAFDTLYAEGQRRYVETLTAYARQFLGQLERPHVEHLRGLSPTIAIEQKSASGNPRSTVGTITEIYDYLRVLYARVGRAALPPVRQAGARRRPRRRSSTSCCALPAGHGVTLARAARHAPQGRVPRALRRARSARLRCASRRRRDRTGSTSVPALDKKHKHTIELVVDRITVRRRRSRGASPRASSSRCARASGELRDRDAGDGQAAASFSETRACCGNSFPELSPQSFSFNSPLGMCRACNGLGTRAEVDPELVVPDTTPLDPQRRDRAVGHGDGARRGLDLPHRRRGGQGVQGRPRHAVEEARQEEAEQVLYGLGGRRSRSRGARRASESHGTWGMSSRASSPT